MRCLALDVGERRTGVAIGERIARPLTTLTRRSRAEDFCRIANLIREHKVDTLVVGMPLNLDGSRGFQARRVSRYAERMTKALSEMDLGVELVFWDERLTTEEADRILAQKDRSRSGREQSVDAVAAAVILQSYLDQHSGTPKGGESER
jgi:putative Holliday junction resolvase